MVFLTVRAAAKQIGVHENTLRDWERRGIIRAVRLPTGVRRFPEDEVLACATAIMDSLGRTKQEPETPGRPLKAGSMKLGPRNEGF